MKQSKLFLTCLSILLFSVSTYAQSLITGSFVDVAVMGASVRDPSSPLIWDNTFHIPICFQFTITT